MSVCSSDFVAQRIINIPSLLFGVLVNFFLPIALYKIALRRRDEREKANGFGTDTSSLTNGIHGGDHGSRRSDVAVNTARPQDDEEKLASMTGATERTPLVGAARVSRSSESIGNGPTSTGRSVSDANLHYDQLSLLPAFLQRGDNSAILANTLIGFFALGTFTSLFYAVADIVDALESGDEPP